MNRLAFISYRRADSLAATRGLAEQLRAIFGLSQIFIDNTIDIGQKWPDRIEQALSTANVLLAVIGPSWLIASDKYGRRRLDIETDWVRREIQTALQLKIPIIPVLVGGANLPDESEALPEPLAPLLNYKWHTLPDDAWDSRLRELIRRLEKDYGFVPNEKLIEFPEPRVEITTLTLDELDAELRTLKGWELVESHIPGDYPNSRLELRKVFKFKDFLQAMQFMNNAIAFIERPNPYAHHPRWENLWRTVTVWLSTWDIKHRVSRLDILLAKELDRIYWQLSPRLQEAERGTFMAERSDYQWQNDRNIEIPVETQLRQVSSRLPESPRGALFGRAEERDGVSLKSTNTHRLQELEKENAALKKKLRQKH